MTQFNDAFWRWFGDSVVVDAKGNPLVVYHWTKAKFTEFKAIPITDRIKGIWFASNPETASWHSLFRSGGLQHAQVLPVYIRIENPHIVKDQKGPWPDWNEIVIAKMNRHDGVIFENHLDAQAEGRGDLFVVFKPTQAKSALSNDGTWDEDDADIRSNPDAEFLYHATNEDSAWGIGEDGKLVPHRPDYGTDQEVWPDGSTEKRSYFSKNLNTVYSFAPERGKTVILRVPLSGAFRREMYTGDYYTTKAIPASVIEVLEGNEWLPLAE